jgi:hypothetical protein
MATAQQYLPTTAHEKMLVLDIAKYKWLVDRAIRLQGEAIEHSSPTYPARYKCWSAARRPSRSSQPTENNPQTTKLASFRKSHVAQAFGLCMAANPTLPSKP